MTSYAPKGLKKSHCEFQYFNSDVNSLYAKKSTP